MKEFTIMVSYVVDAHDYDEAVDIAKAVLDAVKDEHPRHVAHGYKLRDVETSKIEEV